MSTLRGEALAAAFGATLLLAAPAAAERADRDKPINYSADSGDVNIQTKVGTLVGNVVLTQGTLTIHADRVMFRQNPDNSLSATAWGNPVTFRQKRDGVNEYYEGFAQRGEYDGSKDLLQLFDRGLLRRGGDEIRSNYISYNTATELFKAEGRAGSGPADGDGTGARVRGVFQPRNDTTPARPESGNKPVAGKLDAPVTLKPAGELSPGKGK